MSHRFVGLFNLGNWLCRLQVGGFAGETTPEVSLWLSPMLWLLSHCGAAVLTRRLHDSLLCVCARARPQLASRWHQFGSVCPLYRSHGSRPTNEPWSFGPQAEQSITKSIQLRATLQVSLSPRPPSLSLSRVCLCLCLCLCLSKLLHLYVCFQDYVLALGANASSSGVSERQPQRLLCRL